MPEYLAPGVYVEEISSGVQAVAAVSTSTTGFVGITKHGPVNRPVTLSSMLAFEQVFGGAPRPMFRLEKHKPRTGPSPLGAEGATRPAELPETTFRAGPETYALIQTNPAYALFAALRMYFANGGSRCQVVSCGHYGDDFDSGKMLEALNTLESVSDLGLIVIPEVTRLPRAEAATVNQAVLAQCAGTGSRFAILDIPGGYLDRTGPRGDPIAAFRDDIGTHGLDYGAAYYPWLETATFRPEDFTFANIDPDSRPLLQSLVSAGSSGAEAGAISAPTLSGDFTILAKPGQTVKLTLEDFRAMDDSRAKDLRYSILDTGNMTGRVVTTGTTKRRNGFRQRGLAQGKISFARDKGAIDPGQFDIVVTDKDGRKSAQRTVFVLSQATSKAADKIARSIATETAQQQADMLAQDRTLRRASPLYADITRQMARHANTMPPGAAMAGVYARTDATRGVWKAPAGISVSGVVRPTVKLRDRDQSDLNTPVGGTSVNTIRSFTGRGILAWGARTMAGRDNEWRYVPVRRFAIMIEQSLARATSSAIFAENDAQSWAAIRTMANHFLTGLWRSGGLAGQRASDAYFVKVGLGETMTEADVNNGRLILDIGFAPVRPAEFVILRIQHKTQDTS